MTDPADRLLSAEFLEGRLHELAHGVPVPVVAPEDDVRRGRRRLVRMRLAMAGATCGALALVVGITGLTAGDPRASEVSPAGTSSSSAATPAAEAPASSSLEDDASGFSGGAAGRPVAGASSTAPTAVRGSAGAAAGSGLPVRDDPGSHPTPDGDGGTVLATAPYDPTPAPTPAASALPSEDPTGTTASTPTPSATPTGPSDEPVHIHLTLGAYNDVLAARLDAARDHLQGYDRELDPSTTTYLGDDLSALGATYRWSGRVTTAALGIVVATGWDQVDWECGTTGTTWDCRTVEATTPSAEVARHDGLRQVAVEHSGGRVVVLTADPGVHLSDAALAAAASDDRLALPGEAPQP